MECSCKVYTPLEEKIMQEQVGKEDFKKGRERAVSKYGITIVCDKAEEQEEPDLVLPDSDGCHKMRRVASKLGYQVICEEEDEKGVL